MIEKAILLLSGNAAASLLLLIRNLLVARLIPVADYGVAATFALVMAGVEMASELGLRQQIVQARNGENPRFQASLQAFQLLRGLVAGVALFLLAGPLASFFGIPEVAWAYQVLAIVPVLYAAVHFDIHRLNRQMRFGPMLWSGVIPAAVALVLVWPLALWLGDWQVMLWSVVAQAALTMLVSHLLAERRYRLAWDPAIMGASLRFGWPLLVNALLMFAVLQADKLIVGRILGLEMLAIFALGMTLTVTPTLVMAKSAQNLYLPRLSELGHAPGQTQNFQRQSQITLQISVAMGAAMILAFTIFGAWIVEILLGPKYAALGPLMGLFGLLNGMRLMKAAPSIVALAKGVTSNTMIANLPRIFVLPVVVWMLMQGGTLSTVLWLSILAESLGFLIALALMRARTGQGVIGILPVWIALAAFLTVVIAPVPVAPIWHLMLQIGAFVVLLLSMQDLHALLERKSRS